MTIDETQAEEQLRQAGFSNMYVWRDEPGTYYSDHTHATVTAHIILGGEMTVFTAGESRTYTAGERFDVPANTVHSAEMGPAGCRYIVGEK